MRFSCVIFLYFYSLQLNQEFIYGSVLQSHSDNHVIVNITSDSDNHEIFNATSDLDSLKTFTILNIGSEVAENSSVCVQAIWRHGARMQLTTFPTDEHYPRLTGNEAIGQLTLDGIIGSQRLGKYLRSRYDNFLAKNFSLTELYLLSSETHRTVMTALGVAQGLFPTIISNSENERDSSPLWYPVPVMTIPNTMDNYILPLRDCKRHSQIYEQYKNSSKINTGHALDLYRYLSLHSGNPVGNFDDVYNLHDTIFTIQRDLFRLPVPDWAASVEHQMSDIARYEFIGLADSFEMMRFAAGPLLHKIVFNFNCTLGIHIQTSNSDDNCKDTKMYGFSAHDTTIAPLLYLFGHYNIDSPQSPPPFNALLLFELHQNENEHFIRIFYRPKNEKGEHPIRELLLKSCGNVPCEFNRFQEIYKEFIIDDATWQKYCDDVTSPIISNRNIYGAPSVHGNE